MGHRGDVSKIVRRITWNAKESSGSYFTPQQLNRDVLTRSDCGKFPQVRQMPDGKGSAPKLTSDSDVLARPFVLIDVDPDRPKDTCATNE